MQRAFDAYYKTGNFDGLGRAEDIIEEACCKEEKDILGSVVRYVRLQYAKNKKRRAYHFFSIDDFNEDNFKIIEEGNIEDNTSRRNREIILNSSKFEEFKKLRIDSSSISESAFKIHRKVEEEEEEEENNNNNSDNDTNKMLTCNNNNNNDDDEEEEGNRDTGFCNGPFDIPFQQDQIKEGITNIGMVTSDDFKEGVVAVLKGLGKNVEDIPVKDLRKEYCKYVAKNRQQLISRSYIVETNQAVVDQLRISNQIINEIKNVCGIMLETFKITKEMLEMIKDTSSSDIDDAVANLHDLFIDGIAINDKLQFKKIQRVYLFFLLLNIYIA